MMTAKLTLEEIPDEILSALRNREFTEEQILAFSPKRMFDEYCNWHGLIHWGNTLWNQVHSLMTAVADKTADDYAKQELATYAFKKYDDLSASIKNFVEKLGE